MISEYDEPDIARKAVQHPEKINFVEHIVVSLTDLFFQIFQKKFKF
jgi:hypothetical protein